MKRLITPAAAIAAALALGACGGGGGDSGTSGSASAGESGNTVSVRQVSGVGRVLVDSSGKALYTPDQEADGKVRCSGSCSAFWKPLEPGAGTPTAAPGSAKLAVIKRPDGTTQVTDDGKPLYTFTEDSPGNVTGNGFADDFDGRHFTWHAVLASGPATGAAGGTGASSSGGSGGY